MAGLSSEAAALIARESVSPLCLQVASSEDASPARLEFTSRGDRVPGYLWANAEAKAPLIVLQYAAGGSVDPHHGRAAQALRAAGFHVASVDWPLHGARQSPKLTERLLSAFAATGPDPNGAELVRHALLQSALDLARLLDAIDHLDGVQPVRTGLAGTGLGGVIGLLFAAIDPRPGAIAVLTHADSATQGLMSWTADTLLAWLGEAEDRPTLFVASATDGANHSEAEALRARAGAAASLTHLDASLAPIGEEAAGLLGAFFSKALR